MAVQQFLGKQRQSRRGKEGESSSFSRPNPTDILENF